MPRLLPAFSTDLGALYNTDCLNLFSALRADSVDCVFADPPFNLGKDYGNGAEKDELQSDDYLSWCYSWLGESVRVTKPGGAVFVYSLPRWAFHFAVRLEALQMTFRHWIAVSMKGTFPRGRKLYPAHYALLYFTKGSPAVFNKVRLPIPKCRHCGGDVKDYGGHRKYLNPAGLNLTDFWEDTAPARHRKYKARWHVNELKPLIPSRCIEISTNEGDVILDPFGGGGSSYEAAQRLKRFWLGAEISNTDLISERFSRNLPGVKRAVPRRLSELLLHPSPRLEIPCHQLTNRSHTTEPRNVQLDLVLARS
jgi:DNA modification methylase